MRLSGASLPNPDRVLPRPRWGRDIFLLIFSVLFSKLTLLEAFLEQMLLFNVNENDLKAACFVRGKEI